MNLVSNTVSNAAHGECAFRRTHVSDGLRCSTGLREKDRWGESGKRGWKRTGSLIKNCFGDIKWVAAPYSPIRVKCQKLRSGLPLCILRYARSDIICCCPDVLATRVEGVHNKVIDLLRHESVSYVTSGADSHVSDIHYTGTDLPSHVAKESALLGGGRRRCSRKWDCSTGHFRAGGRRSRRYPVSSGLRLLLHFNRVIWR